MHKRTFLNVENLEIYAYLKLFNDSIDANDTNDANEATIYLIAMQESCS